MSRTWPPSTIRFSVRKSAVDVWWMIGLMPAVGELVRCTDGSWMTRPPQSCPRGGDEFAIGLGDVVASPCLADSGKHADLCQHGRHVHIDRLA